MLRHTLGPTFHQYTIRVGPITEQNSSVDVHNYDISWRASKSVPHALPHCWTKHPVSRKLIGNPKPVLGQLSKGNKCLVTSSEDQTQVPSPNRTDRDPWARPAPDAFAGAAPGHRPAPRSGRRRLSDFPGLGVGRLLFGRQEKARSKPPFRKSHVAFG